MFLHSFFYFDQSTVEFFQIHQTPVLHEVFSFFSLVGQWWFILCLFIVLVILFSRRWWYRKILALFVGSLVTEGVVFLLKEIIPRARPPYHSYSLFMSHSSFPSGHAALAVSFYGFLLFFLLRHEVPRPWRMVVLVLGVFFILAIGFSRIYLGVHYPTDVIAGFLIGGVFFFLSVHFATGKLSHFLRWFLARGTNVKTLKKKM